MSEIKNLDLIIHLDELEAKYPITSDIDERYELHKKYRSYLEDQLEKDPKNIHALIHLGIMRIK